MLNSFVLNKSEGSDIPELSKFEERMNILKATKKVLSFLLAVMLVFSCVTCAFADETVGTDSETPDNIVDVNGSENTEEPEATATPEAAEATATPEATAEPEVTAEPEATATPEATAEATATPEASATPKASATPEPTATPDPNAVTEDQLKQLEELIATAKANIEYKGTNHTLQNATEELEEILADTSSLTKEDAESLIQEYSEIVDAYSVVFTNMNIPYSTFFAAYTSGSNLSVVQQDVVTTATTRKMLMTDSLAKGTYNDGTNILGVTMIVRMFKMDYEKIKDAHEGQGGDYGFTVIEPKTTNDYEFMRLTVNDDGSYKFKPSYINLDSRGLSVGELTTDTSYGDYQFTLLGAAADGSTCGIWNDVTYYAMVVKTSYQTGYAMYALNNMWFASRNTNGLEVAWSVIGGQGLTNHGGQQFYQYDGMNGQDIVQIALYTSRGVITMGSNNNAKFTLPAYYTGDVSELSATIDTASTEVEIAGVPSDLTNPKVTITYSPGRHQNVTVVENADIVDGKVQLESALEFGQNYVIKLTSDNYAQITVPYTTKTDLKAVSAYGSTFYVADLKNLNSAENVTFRLTKSFRGQTSVEEYNSADLTALADTTFVYTGATALEGDIYAYTKNDAVSYADLYKALGASVDVDVVSSATNFTGYHAKDISDIVSYGTDDNGNKVITGVSTEKTYYTVDAKAYLTAVLKNAFGYELAEDESTLVSTTLKANASAAPSDSTVEVKLSSVEYTDSKYGVGEFVIVPDDSVEGYVWNEYWNNVYGATISNGTTTAGAVHWIDLYGENSASGYHYNKIELALNNGTSTASNAANVTRYADFLDADNNLKPGTYTITIKSAGYTDLVATYTVAAPKQDQKITVTKAAPVKTYGDAAFYIGGKSQTSLLSYDSDNTSVIVVDKTSGKATIKGAGEANITITSEGNDTYNSATRTIKVVVNKAAMTAVSDNTVFLRSTTANKYAQITVDGGEVKASYKVTYGSKSTSYVTVSSTGKITIKKNAPKGAYKIAVTAPSGNNYNAGSKTLTIYVKESQPMTVKATKTVFTRSTTANQTAYVKTTNAQGSVTYSVTKNSKATNYVTVSTAGKITVKKNAPLGAYIITVKAAGNSSYVSGSKTIKIYVKSSQNLSVKLTKSSFTRSTTANQTAYVKTTGAQGTLTYTVTKDSKSTNYVTVSTAGKITVKKNAPKGTYKITVKSSANASYYSSSKTVTLTVK